MVNTATHSLFIARFAPEVATKSDRTRRRLTDILCRNVRVALTRAGLPARVFHREARLLVFTGDEHRARNQLSRVFGIGTISCVRVRSHADLESMARVVERGFVREISGRRYAVRARRHGRHSFGSMDVERHLGAVLNKHGTVDLGKPDITVQLEILDQHAFFFTERARGAGGLPIGASGRALVLFSGGFDSAVAAWQMMKRGIAVDFVFCNIGGAAYERQVLQVAKVLSDLWAFGTRPNVYVVDFASLVDALRSNVASKLWQVVLKRLMHRAASRLAHRVKATALVTGESVGQVSSQTLSNLRTIEMASDCLVLRPLIGHDKREIMDQARRIGTGLLSERIPEFCALDGGPPVVRSRPDIVEREEAKVGKEVVARAVETARCVELDGLSADELRTDYLFVDKIPEGAEIIDLQPARLYARWHLPGAVNRSRDELMRRMRQLDKRKCYVLYCPFGTESGRAAELLQQLGYQAYAFKGRRLAPRRNDHPAASDESR